MQTVDIQYTVSTPLVFSVVYLRPFCKQRWREQTCRPDSAIYNMLLLFFFFYPEVGRKILVQQLNY